MKTETQPEIDINPEIKTQRLVRAGSVLQKIGFAGLALLLAATIGAALVAHFASSGRPATISVSSDILADVLIFVFVFVLGLSLELSARRSAAKGIEPTE